MTETFRNTKAQDGSFRSKLRDDFMLANPGSSKERIDAAVFRLSYEKKLVGEAEVRAISITLIP